MLSFWFSYFIFVDIRTFCFDFDFIYQCISVLFLFNRTYSTEVCVVVIRWIGQEEEDVESVVDICTRLLMAGKSWYVHWPVYKRSGYRTVKTAPEHRLFPYRQE